MFLRNASLNNTTSQKRKYVDSCIPVFLNWTPILAVCRDDAEKFGDFGHLLVVQEYGHSFLVVQVDVSDLIDSFGKEAGPLQCDFTSGSSMRVQATKQMQPWVSIRLISR